MRRWRILTIGNTDIFLHPSILPCAAYAMLTGHSVLWLMASLAIIIHECAHALAATLFKCPPTALELTPLGAVMRIEDESKLPPLKRAIMLLAGPLFSLMLCGMTTWLCRAGWLDTVYAYQLFISSLSIVMINFLPVLPLDGGRLLYLTLGSFSPERIAGRVMRILGSFTGFGLILLNLVISFRHGGWNLSLAFAGCTILYSTSAAMATGALQELRILMDRKIAFEHKRIMRCTTFCVIENAPLGNLLRICPARQQAFFCVMSPGTMDVLGWLNEHQVIQYYLANPSISAKEALFLCQNRSESAKCDTI